ncbi:hypothetical protein [Haloarchaeobius sp. DFWS5]|uniref:hypothetical protein n=1 Tax=Haloarchaeobius sp. DFWS5 TaxID=3446114 RepID=UPI003EB718CE
MSVDGESEGANVSVSQTFEGITASAVEDAIAETTSGASNPFEVLYEQSFDGETVQVIGMDDAELPLYQMWLPYGSDERRYYKLRLRLTSSILRLDEDNVAQPLCVEETVAGIETIRESLTVNPETTVEEA